MKAFFIGLVCFAIASFISSCASSRVVGQYVENKGPSTGNEILIINNDSTFSYTLLFDVGGTFRFDGRWKIKNGTLILIEVKPHQSPDEDSWLKEIPTREWRIRARKLISSSGKTSLTKVK